jgi:hypothetical protein
MVSAESVKLLHKGQIIKMQSWYGVVLDVFKNEQNRTVLRVQTVRNVFRRLGPEFIEIDLAPHAIALAGLDELQSEIERYQSQLQNSLDDLINQVNGE